MLKRTVFVLTVLACVGVVYGAAVKHTDFMFDNEPYDPSVMAILNYTSDSGEGDKTIIKIMMSGFTPMTQYDLLLREPGLDCPCGVACAPFLNFAPLFTDENGDAMLHLVQPTFDLSTHSVELYVSEDSCLCRPEDVGVVPGCTESDLRAISLD